MAHINQFLKDVKTPAFWGLLLALFAAALVLLHVQLSMLTIEGPEQLAAFDKQLNAFWVFAGIMFAGVFIIVTGIGYLLKESSRG